MPEDPNGNSNHTTIIDWVVTYVPWVIAFFIFFAVGNPVNNHIIALAAFVAGFTGVIAVLRKEIPAWPTMINGRRAVIEGILLTVFFWSLAIIVYIAPN